jgi:hypothetical protein
MSVQIHERKHAVDRYVERRRGSRMNSRVPVRLEWDDSKGQRISLEAHTRVVNPYGCMIILEKNLPLEHRLALINLTNENSNSAVVVWKGTQRPEGGWEYGIELVAPDQDFWGLQL